MSENANIDKDISESAEFDAMKAHKNAILAETERGERVEWLFRKKLLSHLPESPEGVESSSPSIWDEAISVAKEAEATFYVEFSEAVKNPTKLAELAAAKTVVAALEAAKAKSLAVCPHCNGERTLGDCQVTQRLHAEGRPEAEKCVKCEHERRYSDNENNVCEVVVDIADYLTAPEPVRCGCRCTFTNAPERIYAWTDDLAQKRDAGFWHLRWFPEDVEYVRADVSAQALATARQEGFVAGLEAAATTAESSQSCVCSGTSPCSVCGDKG